MTSPVPDAQQVIADALHTCGSVGACMMHWCGDHCTVESDARQNARRAVSALRDAGLLLGPDQVAVDREALRTALTPHSGANGLPGYSLEVRRIEAQQVLLARLERP